MPDIDPITTEIIRCALGQAAEDMNTTLIRSAYTPTIYEAKDCAVALLDEQHRVLAQSSGLPIFLGNLEECTRATEARFGRSVWEPGDVWVMNDAYISGAHLNDVTVYAPIFTTSSEPELLGFAAARAHWIDVGSKDPGGSMDSTSIYQEGLRLGATRIVRSGTEDANVIDMIALNSRFPDLLRGDLRAQIACVVTGQNRLSEIWRRWGTSTLRGARDAYFAQTAVLELEAIRAIPNGSYRASGTLDDDGIDSGTELQIVVDVEVTDEAIRIDLSESSDQATGPVNCGRAQAVSACRVAYKALLSPELPLDGGSFLPLDVAVRAGSMLGAVEPAAVQYYYSQLGLLIDLVVTALAEVLPDRAAAASYGDSMIVQFVGTDPRSGRPFISQEATVGGWGAWNDSDGESCLINNVNGSLRDMPIEVLETLYPVRVERYGIREGSGGNGRRRGGDGVVREYTFLADQTLSLWWERSRTPAWGLFGGGAGAAPAVRLNPGSSTERFILKVNALPVSRGDVLRCESGGGGGYGSPLD